ncbi:MAG: FAD-dependent oxidoreductase [Candidatus Onthovivens sp.]|nr:FAD-dependent oxidoreductase [Candidatus Onthovivens sp.]
MREVDIAIIGGGSAGLAAAISAYDTGVKDIVLFEKSKELGGILNQCIHNGFGLHTFKEELTGPEYAHRFIEEFNKRGIEALTGTLVLSISQSLVLSCCNENGLNSIKAKRIIYAAGCNERTYGQISIPGNRPNGVYTAGLAQKYLNIDGYLVGKNVYILGSGDIGLIMARRMTLEGAHVIGVSELMPYSNGLNRNIVQCLNDFNIPLRLHNTVTKIIGKDQLEAIEICDVDDTLTPIESTKQRIECDTLLLSVGLYPYNGLLQNAGCLSYQKTKGAFVTQNNETTLKGVYSCGNVLHVHDLVDFVSKEAAKTGKKAAESLLFPKKKIIKTIGTNALDNLGYLLPNLIEIDSNLKEVEFSFRVRKPISKGKIVFSSEDKVIKTITKTNLIPSEMQTIVLKDVNFLDLEEVDVRIVEE